MTNQVGYFRFKIKMRKSLIRTDRENNSPEYLQFLLFAAAPSSPRTLVPSASS